MDHSNVSFVPLGDGLVASTKQLAFDERLPVDAEAKELLCVGNASRGRVKVQLVASEKEAEKAAVRVAPDVAVLERGMACEFEVFVTPHCTCALRDDVCVVARGASGRTVTKRVGVALETELSTRLHYDDVAAEKQIGEGSFGVVFKGTFHGQDVAIKKMKEVDASAGAMEEFAKEVAMLDKFRCDEIVHFYGACFIPNHVMMVTEYAPCGSLADCIKELPEQPETVRARLIEPARRLLRTRRRAWPQALRRATGSRGDADASFAGRCVSFCLTTTLTT